MKKLMILTAALATGVMAYGELSNKFDASNPGEDWTVGWTGATVEGKAALADGVLKITTGSDKISRSVKGDGEVFSIADNLYFDVSLNMLGQALDELPSKEQLNNAKLALFLLDTTEIEGAPAGTNLYAIAKNPKGGKMLARLDADASLLLNAEKTSRLTVKAYKNVLKGSSENPGYLVFQDGSTVQGETTAPLSVYAAYAIQGDGSVDWTDFYDGTYLSGVLISSLGEKRNSVLLGLMSGAEGQSFNALDFYGNANISTVEMNDSGFTFIEKDNEVTTIALDGVSIVVTPTDENLKVEDVYDAEKKLLMGSCTIKVTLTDSANRPILKYTNADYLVASAENPYTLTYTYKAGNDVTIWAVAAGAYVGNTAYETLADAVAAAAEQETAEIRLNTAVNLDSEATKQIMLESGDITLDLAGHVIKGAGDEDNPSVIYVAGGTLTIKDTVGGGGIAPSQSDVKAVLVSEGAVAIMGGTYDGAIAVKEDCEGTIVITGGKFVEDPSTFVDGTKYSVKPEGVYYAVSEGTGTVLDPAQGTVTVDSDEAFEALVISATSPDEDVISSEEYTKYFTKKEISRTEDPDTGVAVITVAAVLNEEVVAPDAVAAEIAGKFDEISDAGVAVTKAKPGLFYSVVQGQTLDKMDEGERVMAMDTTVVIPAAKFEGSGFYKVLVNISNKE